MGGLQLRIPCQSSISSSQFGYSVYSVEWVQGQIGGAIGVGWVGEGDHFLQAVNPIRCREPGCPSLLVALAQPSSTPLSTVKRGDRVAQLILERIMTPVCLVATLPDPSAYPTTPCHAIWAVLRAVEVQSPQGPLWLGGALPQAIALRCYKGSATVQRCKGIRV